MSDLTRYRYDVGDETDSDSWGESPTAYMHRKWLESHGYLVPDSTLQDIADAPRCEHGMIDEHWWPSESILDEESQYMMPSKYRQCEGAPELRALLDGLVNDE